MMSKHIEKCGYTRAMYNPEKEGTYLVKTGYEERDYSTAFWNGVNWDLYGIICWTVIPRTEIEAPF